MASGDPIAEAIRIVQPGANFASEDTRPGGSTPAETILVNDFPAAVVTYLDFLCRLAPAPKYAGGGLTIKGPWSASSAASGNVFWGAAIRRIQDDASDIDAAHTYVFKEVTDAAPTVNGEVKDVSIDLAAGAEMDNLAAGEKFVLRIRRNSTAGMAGDAELWPDLLAIRET